MSSDLGSLFQVQGGGGALPKSVPRAFHGLPLRRPAPLDPEHGGPEPARKEGPDFGRMLAEGVFEVSEAQRNVRHKMEGLLTGETKGIHEVMEAMGRSEVAFQLMLEVRNRLIEAWRELTRIQV